MISSQSSESVQHGAYKPMCWIQDGAGMRPVLPVFYVANEDDGAAVYRNSLPAAAAEV